MNTCWSPVAGVADTGNAASFTCASHGWTYPNDRLVGREHLNEGSSVESDPRNPRTTY